MATLTPVEFDPFSQETSGLAPVDHDPFPEDLKGINFNAPTPEVRASIDALPPHMRAKALRKWADMYVAKERESGGAGQYVGDVVRNMARGTPVGSWLDEANALTSSAQHAVGLGGAPYDEAKAYQNALDRAADTDTVKIGKIPAIVPFAGGHEVTGADASKVVGGALSATVAPAWRGVTWLGDALRSGLSAAAYGGLYGAGEGDTLDERLANAKTGTLIGGGLGAVAPSIARGAGYVAQGGSNAINWLTQGGRRDPALADYHPSAVREVARHYQTDDLPSIANVRAAELGPQGMIGDMGDASRFATAGLARTPGGELATQALRSRSEGAPARIREAIDQSVGPPDNVISIEQQLRRLYGDAASPHYDAFHSTQIRPDDSLIAILHRVPANVYAHAENLMRMEGHDPHAIAGTGRMIDYIKRGLGQAVEESGGRHTQVGRAYGNLERELRNTVDEMLSPGNPTESSWARARAIAGEGIEGREALELGSGVFRSKRDPHLVAAELGDMTDLGRNMYAVGARNDLRQAMGRAASNFGPTGDNAARRALNSEFARENLDHIIGPDAAGRLTRTIDAENTMAGLDDMARRNSITSTMQAVQKTLPQPIDSSQVGANIHGATVPGLALSAANKILNTVTAGQWNHRQAVIAGDMARMLTARGVPRDEIIRALDAYVTSQVRGRAASTVVRQAVGDILREAEVGVRNTAIDEKRSSAN